MIGLLNGQSDNSPSQVFKLDADNLKRATPTGQRVFVASGDFAGATITLNVSGDGVNFAPLVNNTFSSPTVKGEFLPNELFIRADVTGATGSTNISLHVA